MRKHRLTMISMSLAIGLSAGILWATTQEPAEGTDWTSGKYDGTREQVLELMGYYKNIELTAEQEGVRRQALSSMPAPCCNTFSAATCCCECNLSRSIWGLAKLLITEHEADATAVRGAVEGWIAALNPSGYAGNTCNTGRCNLPFKNGGCGGMSEHRLVFGD